MPTMLRNLRAHHLLIVSYKKIKVYVYIANIYAINTWYIDGFGWIPNPMVQWYGSMTAWLYGAVWHYGSVVVVWCGLVRYSAVWLYGVVWFGMKVQWYGEVHVIWGYCSVWQYGNLVRYYAVWCGIVWYGTLCCYGGMLQYGALSCGMAVWW